MTHPSTTLLDTLLLSAREARTRKLEGKFVVARQELPVELTPLGYLRWYLHPAIDDINTTALYFFEIEIPVGSRTGKWQHQGGVMHFVVAGTGRSEINGVEYTWKPTDALGLPTLPEGTWVQHFNTGDEPARIIVAFPNFDSALGPELGVAMDIVDPCPEFLAESA